KRYGCAMEHAEKVTDFAEKLYVKTRRLHPESDDLIYLKLACLLHNVGYFSDIEYHARCSASLIVTFNIPGMTTPERQMIARSSSTPIPNRCGSSSCGPISSWRTPSTSAKSRSFRTSASALTATA